jgi:acetylornithine deacetylase/succinyl-diaminopimelate desuccinylase-like protein
MKASINLCLLFISFSVFGQKYTSENLEKLSTEYFPSAVSDLREMLSLPNDAVHPGHVESNVDWMESAFSKRNFSIEKLDTGGPPILLASRKGAKSKSTVLFYIQVDGQPVDSSEWNQESPYSPVLKARNNKEWSIIDWGLMSAGYDPEWRIFARSASDAKGPIAMFLAAIDIIDSEDYIPNFDIKVVMDFEEELGSPHLPSAVEKYKQELGSDMLVILDGPRHISNKPTLTFGARGITTVTLTTYGPRVPQHSGHYGNYTPNPVFKMAKLLAGLKDDHGRVTLPGYYDGVIIDDNTMSILRQVPDDEKEIMKNQGIAEIDKVGETYQEAIQYPSLNIRGISSGWVGDEVRTIIPAKATAEIDIRLVKESDSDWLVGLLRDYVENQGFYFVDGEPTEEERAKYSKLISMTSEHSYSAFRTSYNSHVGIWLNSAMTRAFGEEPIRIRTSGGSIPIAPFVSTLNIPAVTVPTVNRDNNQHSPNENIRLGNLYEGIITCLAILTEKMK